MSRRVISSLLILASLVNINIAVESAPEPDLLFNFENGIVETSGELNDPGKNIVPRSIKMVQSNGTAPGYLDCNYAQNGYLYIDQLDFSVEAHRTIIALVSISDWTKRGGGVFGIEDSQGLSFDTLTFAEAGLANSEGRYHAGSDMYARAGIATDSNRYEDDYWRMVGLRYYDDGWQLFVDGEPDGEPFTTASPLRGYSPDQFKMIFCVRHIPFWNPEGKLDGKIRAAMFYNRPLTDEEMKATYDGWQATSPWGIVKPTLSPTQAPTQTTTPPTKFPTWSPTKNPTSFPTQTTTAPTKFPTYSPTTSPTKSPTTSPTKSPTSSPTTLPCWLQHQKDIYWPLRELDINHFYVRESSMDGGTWALKSQMLAPYHSPDVTLHSDRVGTEQDETGKLLYYYKVKGSSTQHTWDNTGTITKDMNNCTARQIQIDFSIQEIMSYTETTMKRINGGYQIRVPIEISMGTMGFKKNHILSIGERILSFDVPGSVTAVMGIDRIVSYGFSDGNFLCDVDQYSDKLMYALTYTTPRAFLANVGMGKDSDNKQLNVILEGVRDCKGSNGEESEICTQRYLIDLDTECKCRNVEQTIHYHTNELTLNISDAAGFPMEIALTDITRNHKCKVSDIGTIEFSPEITIGDGQQQFEVDYETDWTFRVKELETQPATIFGLSLHKAEISGKCSPNMTEIDTQDADYHLLYLDGSNAKSFSVDTTSPHLLGGSFILPGIRCEDAMVQMSAYVKYEGNPARLERRRLTANINSEQSRQLRQPVKAKKSITIKSSKQNSNSNNSNKITIISTIIFGLLITLISV